MTRTASNLRFWPTTSERRLPPCADGGADRTGPLNGTQKGSMSILIRSIDALTQRRRACHGCRTGIASGNKTQSDRRSRFGNRRPFPGRGRSKKPDLDAEYRRRGPRGGDIEWWDTAPGDHDIADNAVKYTAEGGVTVEVRAAGHKSEDASGQGNPSSILISVADSAPASSLKKAHGCSGPSSGAGTAGNRAWNGSWSVGDGAVRPGT